MLNPRRVLGALICTSSLLLASACGSANEPGSNSDDQSGQLNVVVAFYPLQFVAERVAGQHATVSTLTQPGMEPHDLELTPKDVASVGEADFVLYEKSFQPAVDEAVSQSGNENAVDVTTIVPLQATGAEDDHDHGGESEEEDGDHEGESHEGEEEGALDPHIWLDPTNVATIATETAAKLAALDPDNAADYTANAEAVVADLEGLNSSFETGLAKCERTEFITTHEAFGYLAQKYGLTQIGISGFTPDAQPSPARIAEVQEEAKEHGVTTIFYETLVAPDVAESIASDLGLKTDVLDPIEGITEKSKGTDYLSVMESNLTALKTANGCS